MRVSGKALSAKRTRLRISFALARSTALCSGYVLGRPRLRRSTNSHEFTLSCNLGIFSFVLLYPLSRISLPHLPLPLVDFLLRANPSLVRWLGLSTSTLAWSIPPLRKLLPSGPKHWDLGAPKGGIARAFLDIEIIETILKAEKKLSTLKYMKQSTCHYVSPINEWWSILAWYNLHEIACGLRSFLPMVPPSSGEGEMHPPMLHSCNLQARAVVSNFYALEISVRFYCVVVLLHWSHWPQTVRPALGDLRHACGHIELLQQCLQRQWSYMTITSLWLDVCTNIGKTGSCSYFRLRIFLAVLSSTHYEAK